MDGELTTHLQGVTLTAWSIRFLRKILVDALEQVQKPEDKAMYDRIYATLQKASDYQSKVNAMELEISDEDAEMFVKFLDRDHRHLRTAPRATIKNPGLELMACDILDDLRSQWEMGNGD